MVYHETISARRIVALLLMALSVVLLWKDKQEDERRVDARSKRDLESDRCG
jgi:hypothetical protein